MPRKERPGRQYRLKLQMHGLIGELREKMRRVQTVGGLQLNPDAPITASEVIDFALIVANAATAENEVVINREVLLEKLHRQVNENLEAFNAMAEDQRKALLEMIVATNATISPFDRSAPLRAATPASEAKN